MINELKDALRSNDFDAKDKRDITQEIRRIRRTQGFPMPRVLVEHILSYMLLPRDIFLPIFENYEELRDLLDPRRRQPKLRCRTKLIK